MTMCQTSITAAMLVCLATAVCSFVLPRAMLASPILPLASPILSPLTASAMLMNPLMTSAAMAASTAPSAAAANTASQDPMMVNPLDNMPAPFGMTRVSRRFTPAGERGTVIEEVAGGRPSAPMISMNAMNSQPLMQMMTSQVMPVVAAEASDPVLMVDGVTGNVMSGVKNGESNVMMMQDTPVAVTGESGVMVVQGNPTTNTVVHPAMTVNGMPSTVMTGNSMTPTAVMTNIPMVQPVTNFMAVNGQAVQIPGAYQAAITGTGSHSAFQAALAGGPSVAYQTLQR